MTDNYNAGNIVVSTSIDMSGIRKDLKAIQSEVAKAAEDSGEFWVEKFKIGFESGQIGKRIQDGIADGFDAASIVESEGKKAGKGFFAGINSQIGGFKAGFGSSVGKIAGGALRG